MAKKATKAKKQKSLEETLWDSANKLRGSVEPSEYKHVVLSLIFLKFASEKFEHRRQELIEDGMKSGAATLMVSGSWRMAAHGIPLPVSRRMIPR